MLHTASADDTKHGRVTDVYFRRAVEALQAKGIRRRVAAELWASALPGDYGWAVLAGVEKVAELTSGLPVAVCCMSEGTVFHAGEPVLTLEGE
jgi:nicotinate phosphoribosyltransferase